MKTLFKAVPLLCCLALSGVSGQARADAPTEVDFKFSFKLVPPTCNIVKLDSQTVVLADVPASMAQGAAGAWADARVFLQTCDGRIGQLQFEFDGAPSPANADDFRLGTQDALALEMHVGQNGSGERVKPNVPLTPVNWQSQMQNQWYYFSARAVHAGAQPLTAESAASTTLTVKVSYL
ncbi:type 1 fimbrial protein [Luteibacter jiangsuensis]|uniref:Type 1 fimbrial protein n=1 Tax=Luteibacter jiangsuensis TaxID=637577 RepID=A0ABX0Q677_9GAMM|nr:type 1 fimbrial protein [Luteibacter jiangsuensis]NID04693.1 type 1 fimbrial protein [Luteibacter jiangsuensis]